MELAELWNKSMLVLGYGVEGTSTFRLLKELFPAHHIGVADRRNMDDLSRDAEELLLSDSRIRLSYHFGPDYLSSCAQYDVIFKSPGIRKSIPELRMAKDRGAIITSHTELFLESRYKTTIGVTGTKGKGTTSKLIYTILKTAGIDTYLVGNIGVPPLDLLKSTTDKTVFVFEMSSQQLDDLSISPHIAVCLRIVPDHLDHHGTFADYVAAKLNITLHQKSNDSFVFDLSDNRLLEMSTQTRARLMPFSIREDQSSKCYIKNSQIFYRNSPADLSEPIISVDEAKQSLPGEFNLFNILPSIVVAKSCGVGKEDIAEGIRSFKCLPNRFENVGEYNGITFYNASIATVPEVTVEHLRALGTDVQTILLGGFDRGQDFTVLAEEVLRSHIKNVVLFPTTGERIWNALKTANSAAPGGSLPRRFDIKATNGAGAMREAVQISYENTDSGKICLHSPASPSFGLFRDFNDRGELFKKFILELASKEN